MDKLSDTEHLVKKTIIDIFKKEPEAVIDTIKLSESLKVDHQEVVGECKSLEMADVVTLIKAEKKNIQLTADGENCLKNGSPENQLVAYLKINNKKTKKDISADLGQVGDRGFAAAMKMRTVIEYDKKSETVSLKSDLKVDEFLSKDVKQKKLKEFMEDSNPDAYDDKTKKEYEKSLKLTQTVLTKYFEVKRGSNFEGGLVKQETDLTQDLIGSGKWESVKFKKYNYQAKGKEVKNGCLHRLLRVRSQFREILVELGFQEMPTNNYVESSFWNFDSLFQPQQHPARDAHDTFFLTNPKYSRVMEDYPDYFKRVKEMHEIGGNGSIGWQYNWSEEEACKNILRTHTTSVSSRMLFKLAEEYKSTGQFTPKKYFSIDRVFRNEDVDMTHLCEFHQIEGLVADYNLGLGHLIGTIEDFFKRFGIKKLRFKPAYNPYTEPSMEIFAYHEGFKKWVEVGNSGIFRPEMLAPMGLPENVSVIAWGLSLERPTMIYYGLKNIRDLFGHEVKINDTQKSLIYAINI